MRVPLSILLTPIRALSMSAKSSVAHHPKPFGAYTVETYHRNPDHIPNTSAASEETYILALHTDTSHHKALTALRNQHFPPKINKLAAHIVLFRALPGSHLEQIVSDIAAVVSPIKPFVIATGKPFRLAHGVGIEVHTTPPTAPKDIFQELRDKWQDFLSRQDLGSFKAHYTIQNKVEDEEKVKACLESVKSDFHGSRGTVDGLVVYRYDRGWWKKERDFPFENNSYGVTLHIQGRKLGKNLAKALSYYANSCLSICLDAKARDEQKRSSPEKDRTRVDEKVRKNPPRGLVPDEPDVDTVDEIARHSIDQLHLDNPRPLGNMYFHV